jgi:dihydroneopterin aldolase
MAVLAMDQYAELLAARLPRGVRVTGLRDAESALASGRVPVLAPSRWLRDGDPLPHSWDVTSDSIAAWVAGQAGAPSLILVKPRGATGALVDPYFARALPAGVESRAVTADQVESLREMLMGRV